MFQYAVRRILISIPILLVVLTLVFVVVRVLPGDPAVAARFVELGVDSITTDRPAFLRDALQQSSAKAP